MAGKADEIVFEDLHGVDDDARDVDVNLDLDDEEAGITYVDDDESSDDDGDDGAGDTSGDGADDDGDGDGDQGDEDDGGKDRFSKKFNQRLERERRGKEAERQRADKAEAKLKTYRKERAEQRTAETDAEISRLDDEEKVLDADLAEAIDKGDSKTQARITTRLMKITARQERLDAQKEAGFDDFDDDDDGGDAGTPARNELADDWKRANRDWYGRSGFERETRMANRMDNELFAEGYDHHSDEYFEELTTRMKEKAPKLFKDLDADDGNDDDGSDTSDKGRGRQSRSSAAPVTGEGKDRSGSDKKDKSGNKNRVRITAADKANMRRFGLDPTDPAALKEYASNKVQSEEALS